MGPDPNNTISTGAGPSNQQNTSPTFPRLGLNLAGIADLAKKVPRTEGTRVGPALAATAGPAPARTSSIVRNFDQARRAPNLRHAPRFSRDVRESLTARRTGTLGNGPEFDDSPGSVVPFVLGMPTDDPFVDIARPRDPAAAQQYALNADRFMATGRHIIRPRRQQLSPDYKAQGRQAAIVGPRAAEARARQNEDLRRAAESQRMQFRPHQYNPAQYQTTLQNIAQMSAAERANSPRILGVTPGGLPFGAPLFGTGYGQEPPRPVAHPGSVYNEPLPTMFGDLNEMVPSVFAPTRPVARHGPNDGQLDADVFRAQMNQRIHAFNNRPFARVQRAREQMASEAEMVREAEPSRPMARQGPPHHLTPQVHGFEIVSPRPGHHISWLTARTDELNERTAAASGQSQSQQVALTRQQTDDQDDPVMNALVRELDPFFEEDGPRRGLPDLRDLDPFFEDSPVASHQDDADDAGNSRALILYDPAGHADSTAGQPDLIPADVTPLARSTLRADLLSAVVQSATSRRARRTLAAIDSPNQSARAFGSTGYNGSPTTEQKSSSSRAEAASGQRRAQGGASNQPPRRVMEGNTSSHADQTSGILRTHQSASNTTPAIRNVPSMENTSSCPEATVASGHALAQQSELNRSLRPTSQIPNDGQARRNHDPFGMDGASDEPDPWVRGSHSRFELGRIPRYQSSRSLRQTFDCSADDQASPARQANFSRAQVDIGSALARARQNNSREESVFVENPGLKTKVSSSMMRSQASNRSLGQKKPNPQEVYPPDACLFVGNLAMKKSDVELEAGLTQVMGVYGTVHVIMNRDESKGNMPHAWCQFTKKEHAEKALAGAAGAMVHGRPLRIERAKANRWFVIHRRDRGPIGIDEACRVMQVYGPIAHCSLLGEQLLASMDIPYGCQVAFADFDLGRAAKIKQETKAHWAYHIDLLGQKPKLSAVDKAREIVKEYDQTRRTLYVSNLPEFADEQNLAQHFSRFGVVESVNICPGSMRNLHARRGNPSAATRFAFVEFRDFTHAQEALDNSLQFDFCGVRLRTEPKIFKTASSSANATGTPVVRRVESSRFNGDENDEDEGERVWDSRRNRPAALETIEGSVMSGGSLTPSGLAHLSPRAAPVLTAPETSRLGGAMASLSIADANHEELPGTLHLPLGGFGYWPGIQPMTTPEGALSWGVHLMTPLAGGSEHFFGPEENEGGARL